MAKSTCNNSMKPPKGMMRFEVIRSTIKDSLGQYCEPTDFAILSQKEAKRYLDMNFIRVALPDFDEEQKGDDDAVQAATDEADADQDEQDEQEAVNADTDDRPAARGRVRPKA